MPYKDPGAQLAWQRKNRDKTRGYTREYYRKNRARVLAGMRQRYVAAPDGECTICGRYQRRLFWDHNHTTGEFRGWLCNNCNLLLGHAHDDTDRLRAAAEYLENHANPSDETAQNPAGAAPAGTASNTLREQLVQTANQLLGSKKRENLRARRLADRRVARTPEPVVGVLRSDD